jgi:dephospho-CoA kinase
MKIIGITGSIGCGKTTLANIAKDLGYAVYDIDGWVRRIYNNKEFLNILSEIFKGSVKNGIADKKYLRNIVFNDLKKLRQLEDLIFPFLNSMIRKQISKKAKNNEIFFIDIALLFEKGWDKYCDYIIVADVDYETQKQRVMKRDNITKEDFDNINNIQINNNEKKQWADFIINTNKPVNLLKVEMIKLLNIVTGEIF